MNLRLYPKKSLSSYYLQMLLKLLVSNIISNRILSNIRCRYIIYLKNVIKIISYNDKAYYRKVKYQKILG